jgi:hypothetical protein
VLLYAILARRTALGWTPMDIREVPGLSGGHMGRTHLR